MLDKKKKEEIIKKFRTHPNDTGSSEVQIAILTAEIEELTEHLRKHKKDFSSRRGLIRKVVQRKRLLRYLEKESPESFQKLVKKLKIKIAPREDKSLGEDEVIEVNDNQSTNEDNKSDN